MSSYPHRKTILITLAGIILFVALIRLSMLNIDTVPSLTPPNRPLSNRNPLLVAESYKAVTQFHTPPIQISDLQTELQSNIQPLLVDTRAPEEYATSHLPGAILWNSEAGDPPPEAVTQAADSGQPIVFYCSIGVRSGRAGDRILSDHPDARCSNLEGGIFAWAQENGHLEGGDRVHPYDANWGRLLPDNLRSDRD